MCLYTISHSNDGSTGRLNKRHTLCTYNYKWKRTKQNIKICDVNSSCYITVLLKQL